MKKPKKPKKLKVFKQPTGEWACSYCKHEVTHKNGCMHSMQGYICSRLKGHKGNCVACGTYKNSHPLIVWKGDKIIKGETDNA